MRLSKIKLGGFKSFVDPTTVRLPGALSAVVGPNGCGKSNVIDAVRWVMGESSAKHLRGDSMEDVIFNGSSSRKPVGQAYIELVFDNSDGSVGGEYARFNEIAVRRQVARDGQSQYLLNGTRCRRRDITDIFLGTGLGPRSYAIIEQGTISRLIEAKPEELRAYLEEAAGISRYKERRRETENRISHTRENLERLDDLREEVDKHLTHLKRQATIAEKYRSLKDEERRAHGEHLALRLRDLGEEVADKSRRVREEETRLESTVAELRRVEANLEQERQRYAEANEQYHEVQGRYYRIGSEISRTEQSIQHHRELRQRQERELEQMTQALTEAREHMEQDHQRLGELDEELASLEPQQQEWAEAERAAADQLAEIEQAMHDWQQRWEAFNERAAEPARTAEVERARMEEAESQLQRSRSRRERLQRERDETDPAATEAELVELGERAEQVRAQAEQRQQALDEVLAEIDAVRERSQQLAQELDGARQEVQTLSGRQESLQALQQAALGEESSAAGRWLETHGLEDSPRLAQRLGVDPGWEQAVETVLQGWLEAVCVAALPERPHLEAARETGLVFLEDRGEETTPTTGLAEKVRAPRALQGLLEGVEVAETLAQALQRQSTVGEGGSLVTADGYWLSRSWLRVPGGGEQHAGVLARERQLEEIQAALARAQAQVEERQSAQDEAQQQLQDLEAQRHRLQEEVNQAHREAGELDARVGKAQSRVDQARQRLQQLDAELAELDEHMAEERQALQEAEQRRNEAMAEIEGLNQERDALNAERSELQARLDEAREQARVQREESHRVALRLESLRSSRESTVQSLERLQAQHDAQQHRYQELEASLAQDQDPIQGLEAELEQLVAQRVEVEKALSEASDRVQALEAEMREQDQQRNRLEQEADRIRQGVEQLRMDWQEANVRRETLEEQLAETGYTADTLQQELPADAKAEDWQAKLEDLGQRIQRLGAVNLAAIDEYASEYERKEYLDSQHADLTEALETLESAIHKIDRETRVRFKETFDRVNGRLSETFPRLFGGGQGYLQMTGDDLLTTGVAVMARPPGKRLSTIHLMSGGEKALTAVALVFAIFELNPAPFCMLDEVDAPLDDANVGRFCDLVREMSEWVQFILITHNKMTMELADQLIGVTMREPGVSRLVAVDVDEAARMATG